MLRDAGLRSVCHGLNSPSSALWPQAKNWRSGVILVNWGGVLVAFNKASESSARGLLFTGVLVAAVINLEKRLMTAHTCLLWDKASGANRLLNPAEGSRARHSSRKLKEQTKSNPGTMSFHPPFPLGAAHLHLRNTLFPDLVGLPDIFQST